MKRPLSVSGWICCLLLLVTTRASANTCKLDTSGTAFGTYNPIGGAAQTTIGTVTVTCTGKPGDSVSYSVSAEVLMQPGGYRVMTNGGNRLSYLLYVDNAYTRVWGDGSGGSSIISDSYVTSSSQSSRSYPVYGRILGGQTKEPQGAYSASVTLTLTF